jgi:hypothetical protein
MATQFGYMVAPVHNPAGWWYYDQTAEQVGQLLIQNNAMLTNISTYLDVDNTLRFAVIMEPADGRGWWYIDQWTNQVAVLLAQNNATLMDLSAYPGPLDSVRFAVILEPSSPPHPSEWWAEGLDADGIGQMLQAHPDVQLTLLSPYIVPSYTP